MSDDDLESDWEAIRRREPPRGKGKRLDLVGLLFGLLRVEKYTGEKTKSGSAIWDCVCLGEEGRPCGNRKRASTNNLLKGKVKSCGCTRRRRALELGSLQGGADLGEDPAAAVPIAEPRQKVPGGLG